MLCEYAQYFPALDLANATLEAPGTSQPLVDQALAPRTSWGLPLTHWGRDKMDTFSQTIYASSSMKTFEFQIILNQNVFLNA